MKMAASQLPQRNNRWGIAGSTLKWIAIDSMLIDHISAVVLARFLSVMPSAAVYSVFGIQVNYAALSQLHDILRGIGRLAFPIFCFLLVEGFYHTHDRKKYAIRLGMMALISEIPFDLALNYAVLEFSSQNVFFTLLIGLLTMALYEKIEKAFQIPYFYRMLLCTGSVGLGMGAAYLIHCDYGYGGVFCIMMLYLFHDKKVLQLFAGVVSFAVLLFPTELLAAFAFIPIALYNGERGSQNKYFFYLFYPVHLLLLFLICYLMGWNALPWLN